MERLNTVRTVSLPIKVKVARQGLGRADGCRLNGIQWPCSRCRKLRLVLSSPNDLALLGVN